MFFGEFKIGVVMLRSSNFDRRLTVENKKKWQIIR